MIRIISYLIMKYIRTVGPLLIANVQSQRKKIAIMENAKIDI